MLQTSVLWRDVWSYFNLLGCLFVWKSYSCTGVECVSIQDWFPYWHNEWLSGLGSCTIQSWCSFQEYFQLSSCWLFCALFCVPKMLWVWFFIPQSLKYSEIMLELLYIQCNFFNFLNKTNVNISSWFHWFYRNFLTCHRMFAEIT